MSGGFPIDLILFGMVAAFLVLRLRSILGRRTGYERPPTPVEPTGAGEEAARTIDTRAEEVGPPQIGGPGPKRSLPDPASAAGQTLARIRQIDPDFDPTGFLVGAEGAFAMIVDAFARGDRDTLRTLLSPDVFGDFDAAITAREQAGERQRTDLVALRESAILEADLRGTVATIGVRFVSDQINMTYGPDGSVVAGGEAVTETVDVWSFARDLNSADPTWLLVGTRSE
ncbi:Tim44/TimA family putative adaptor protein [Elioraea tepidiphila]|jgi:predicted lipid-binding transport protein (Tim44 family)|uniref:Tim44/TimA family putative adaptor protein n=1 Tax=Elioraea tepidiphila TaxID=457934 RepID=UPI00037D55AC|nr:Tim44/TimA family putative adaptor protein [Elioraea tepidiphila]